MRVWECESMRVWKCESLRVLKCESVKVWKCESVRVWVWKCDNVKVWQYECVRVWKCESIRVWEWESVRVWKCESVRVWECESVRVWKCESVCVCVYVCSLPEMSEWLGREIWLYIKCPGGRQVTLRSPWSVMIQGFSSKESKASLPSISLSQVTSLYSIHFLLFSKPLVAPFSQNGRFG